MILYSGERSAYDEAIVSSSRTWQANYQYYRSSWVTGTQAHLNSFTISDYVSDGSNISMGNVAGGKLTVNLVNVYSSDLKAILSSSKIRIKLGLMGSISIVSRSYVIDDKKITKRFNGRYDCTITAYDLSYKMTDTYITSLENPTCIQIVTEIAEKYGLTVDSSVSEAVSAIDGSTAATFVPLEGFTCKQTLGFMAGCYGCFATINENDAICFKWFEESPDTIAPDRIFEGCEFISEMSERKIKLVESGTQSNPIVAPSNTSGYSISFENPYITQEQATAIYNNKVSGNKISFRVGKLKYKGSPLNNPGTIVTVKDIEEKTAKFYIMKRTLDFDGGLSETIECQGESDTTISYKISSPTQQRINRALSKMESAIKAATDVIQQTKGSTFELIPSDESDPAKGNLGFNLYYKDSGDTAFDNCIIKATAGGIGFSTNGGESFDALALYFYKDESGAIHGCINGEVIKAGSISADKIDTTQLIISKGNVDGLTEEISSISSTANGAKETATNANTMALNVRNGLVTTNNNVSNLSQSVSNLSSELESGYSTLSEEQQKIINICLNEDMTYINGGNIATGSILADSIAARAITADKLSVGVGTELNLFHNSEFYYGTNGWGVSNGKLTSQGKGQSWAYMQLAPTNKYLSTISQRVWLVKDRRYSIIAQIYPLSWSTNASDCYIRPFYGAAYPINGIDLSSGYSYNGETVIKMVFDYSGSTGFVDIGIAFKGIMSSSTTACTINIAWMSLSDATGENTGFYCSRKEWIASGYKESNFLDVSVGGSTTADSFLLKDAFTVDNRGNLITLGTIKSDTGEIGSMIYNRDRMDIVSHSWIIYDDTKSSLSTSKISFINPKTVIDLTDSNYSPEYTALTNVDSMGLISSRIEVDDISEDENNTHFRSMVTSTGFFVAKYENGIVQHYTSVQYNGVATDSFNVTSRESSKKNISEKSNVLSVFKNSKIYEYKMKYDDIKSRKKTGFVIERETPQEVLSDDGKCVNLYSMASMNWKATQEIIERLECLENEVKNLAQ